MGKEATATGTTNEEIHRHGGFVSAGRVVGEFDSCRCGVISAFCVMLIIPAIARGETVTVTIENLAPQNGNYLTPVWTGFHDGGFDIFDMGSPASLALERLAEDGMTGPLAAAFLGSGAGLVEGTIFGPGGPIAPGELATLTFEVDGSLPSSRYFSYATMVIPSNDAFVSNDNPFAYRIFANDGTFLGADFFIAGEQVLDAGTEMNTELPMHTAFFGQAAPNTGIDQNGFIEVHPGFLPAGSGGILDDPQFENADFTRAGYPIAQIRVTPEPTTAAFFLCAGLISAHRARRRRRST